MVPVESLEMYGFLSNLYESNIVAGLWSPFRPITSPSQDEQHVLHTHVANWYTGMYVELDIAST